MEHAISLAKLQEDVHSALKLWHQPNSEGSPLHWLYSFRQTQRQAGCTVREATNTILLEALKTLENDQQEEARLLRRHFFDGEKMQIIARSANISLPTAYRKTNEAIEQLALVLKEQELHSRQQEWARLEQRLERPTYTRLIGAEEHLDHLLEILASPEPPWLISIEGLGGIGKTSLAHALSRRVLGEQLFEAFGWVSARQHIFNPGGGIKPVEIPALTNESLVEKLVLQLFGEMPNIAVPAMPEALTLLQGRLKDESHLIVVDNLETVVDVESLLPTLRDLSNPTKFLLTSRQSLYHEFGIFHYSLPELSEVNTLRLIRYEAELHNLSHLKQAPADDLKSIYETVGGNPLAIRLVVGQTHAYGLDVILDDLTAARGQKVEALYTFIYHQSWAALDEVAQRVVLAMPLVTARKGSLAHLSELSGVDEASLRPALDKLIALNLVDSTGTLADRRYTIHNLTRAFLQEQVLKWQ